MAETSIEWASHVWNPVTGCTRVSEGCDHCYIERTPPFRMQGRRFDKPGVGGTTGVAMHAGRLTQPLRWRKPRRVFVNSLADLFHDDVDLDTIASVFAIMAMTPRHTFQVLTKRHARMRAVVAHPDFQTHVALQALTFGMVLSGPWPLPNVWLGVSVESQQWADIRIPALLETPAAVRWLSCEPLLGPVELKAHWLRPTFPGPAVDWVVAGGESGPGARPMQPDWARSLRDQCAAERVPYFFKQWGEWAPLVPGVATGRELRAYPGALLKRAGKKLAGRELDGRTWDEYPQLVSA